VKGRTVKFDVESKLGSAYGLLARVLGIVIAIAMVVAGITRRADGVTVTLFALTAATILSRAALFGVLDASAWSGVQARYMAPVIPVFICMGMLACRSAMSYLSDAQGRGA